MKYYLKCYAYKLSNILTAEYFDGTKVIDHFEISIEDVKIFDDFEEAEEIRKLIFIETGLNMEIKKYERENN